MLNHRGHIIPELVAPKMCECFDIIKQSVLQENNKCNSEVRKGREGGEGKDGVAYTTLLRNELLGTNIDDLRDAPDERRALSPIQSPNLYHVSYHTFSVS